jgi:hypothetical protein
VLYDHVPDPLFYDSGLGCRSSSRAGLRVLAAPLTRIAGCAMTGMAFFLTRGTFIHILCYVRNIAY